MTGFSRVPSGKIDCGSRSAGVGMPEVKLSRPGVADAVGSSPRIAAVRIVPVAGQDSMLLNLSGAHGPYFTRNVVLIRDDAGHTGISELPGGESIRAVLEAAT